ncbi:hypothetical protein [Aureivirga sp. CE67]|uniref:hypothetical protein n=1 Tax=Aureivirga sp. CE67 TaxID=1788983 RepID=UPI0018CA5C31|nr:hypothetical protein [Aureivirga sp. CE67]
MLNLKIIFKAIFPIVVLLFFILLSELKTEGDFGGLIHGFKIIFFFFTGVGLFLFTSIKNISRILKGKLVQESKIILSVLLISTIIGVSSFWFPYDLFDKEPEFVAMDTYRNKLTLTDGKYMLKTKEIEWTTINRGDFRKNSDTIFLDMELGSRFDRQTNKYLIRDKNLIPIYSNEIETDSFWFLRIIKNEKK